MSTDKIIKKQALSYLAKENWATAIAGFFLICLPTILILLFLSIPALLTELFSGSYKAAVQGTVIIASELFSLILAIFATPMITGYLRLCYNISKGEKAQISDIFYYYGKNLLGKCIQVNLKIIAGVLLHFILVILPAFFCSVIYVLTDSYLVFTASIILCCLAFVETLFYSVKYTVVPCVLFEDESLEARDIFRLGTSFIAERKGSAKMLLFTFFPYFALCFFVVPWIFVFPYLSVSFMTNGKWLTCLYTKLK